MQYNLYVQYSFTSFLSSYCITFVLADLLHLKAHQGDTLEISLEIVASIKILET